MTDNIRWAGVSADTVQRLVRRYLIAEGFVPPSVTVEYYTSQYRDDDGPAKTQAGAPDIFVGWLIEAEETQDEPVVVRDLEWQLEILGSLHRWTATTPFDEYQIRKYTDVDYYTAWNCENETFEFLEDAKNFFQDQFEKSVMECLE